MKMTNLKKILVLTLCAAMLLGVLAGCGGKEDPEDTTPVYDSRPVGILLLACDATLQVTYDGGGLVLKLEGIDDNGASIVEQYANNNCVGAACSTLVVDLIQKCYTAGHIDSEYPNIIIKQAHDSQAPGTMFLEDILKDAQEASPTDAPILLVKTESLDEQGYINAETAKTILQTTLGLISPNSIKATGPMTDEQYPFVATVGGRQNSYTVHAVTGQVVGVRVQEPDYENYYEETPDTNPVFIDGEPIY